MLLMLVIPNTGVGQILVGAACTMAVISREANYHLRPICGNWANDSRLVHVTDLSHVFITLEALLYIAYCLYVKFTV